MCYILALFLLDGALSRDFDMSHSWPLTINYDFPNPALYQKMNFEMGQIMKQVKKTSKKF